jgi:hypothetical protein
VRGLGAVDRGGGRPCGTHSATGSEHGPRWRAVLRVSTTQQGPRGRAGAPPGPRSRGAALGLAWVTVPAGAGGGARAARRGGRPHRPSCSTRPRRCARPSSPGATPTRRCSA